MIAGLILKPPLAIYAYNANARHHCSHRLENASNFDRQRRNSWDHVNLNMRISPLRHYDWSWTRSNQPWRCPTLKHHKAQIDKRQLWMSVGREGESDARRSKFRHKNTPLRALEHKIATSTWTRNSFSVHNNAGFKCRCLCFRLWFCSTTSCTSNHRHGDTKQWSFECSNFVLPHFLSVLFYFILYL